MTEPAGLRHASALFISDLHLSPETPRTLQRLADVLHAERGQVEALFILGDLFEAYIGDDDLSEAANAALVEQLVQVSQGGTRLYVMHGNRDFLLHPGFEAATGAQLIPDPTIIELAGVRTVLAHGDALCTDDAAYQQFRVQMRSPAFQQATLGLPLAARREKARQMREQSRMANQNKAESIMDVNAGAVDALMSSSGASILVHGHTHRPARHVLTDGRQRFVLPDWDYDGDAARGGWLKVDAGGWSLVY